MAFLGSLSSTTADAQTRRTVVLSGDRVPGADPGVVFDDLTANPSTLDDSGRVTFLGVLTGPGVDAGSFFSDVRGIYREDSDTLVEVAREGSPVPGANRGVLFGRIGFFATSPLVQNGSGQTAFNTSLAGSVDLGSNRGVYREGRGTLTELVRSGSRVPNPDPRTLFSDFRVVQLNGLGQTAFNASLRITTRNSGIYREEAGVLTQVAREGNPAPGADPGVVFGDLLSSSFLLNDAGQIAFRTGLTGTGVNRTNDSALYREDMGVLAEVVREGDQAPGADPGVLFNSFFNTFALNDSGRIAFGASLSGAGVDFTNNSALYREDTGVLTEVARKGDQVPGAGPGVLFSSFLNNPTLNDAGQTAFRASLTGAGVDFTNNSGLYRESAGALTEVARKGDQAPGAEPGVSFDILGQPVLNDAGQVAFLGVLAGAGVDSTNDRAIYVSSSDGVLFEVLREGDVIDVNDDPLIEDFRTISSLPSIAVSGSSNENERFNVFNGRGQLVFRAAFTDGSSGVFVSDLSAVPEPSTLLLAVMASAGLMRPRRSLSR